LWALRPCKAFGHSISASLPKPQAPFPGKGAILLGLPPLDPVGGGSPKARMLWLLAKSYKQGRLCQLNQAVMHGRIKTAAQSRCTMQRLDSADFAEMQNQQSKQR